MGKADTVVRHSVQLVPSCCSVLTHSPGMTLLVIDEIGLFLWTDKADPI